MYGTCWGKTGVMKKGKASDHPHGFSVFLLFFKKTSTNQSDFSYYLAE